MSEWLLLNKDKKYTLSTVISLDSSDKTISFSFPSNEFIRVTMNEGTQISGNFYGSGNFSLDFLCGFFLIILLSNCEEVIFG